MVPAPNAERLRLLSHPLVRITVLVLTVRLVSASVGALAHTVFPLYQPEPFTVLERHDPFWDSFARYDSGWYFGIARDGYRYLPNLRNNLAFFPVYPLAMRYGGTLLGSRQEDYYQAGILISWLACFAAMIVLYKLARLDLDPGSAERAVLYAAVFPFAFFFGRVYSESLFLLLALCSFYGFRTGRWVLGFVTGALAAATRPNGILILPALAWIVWRRAGSDRRELVRGLAAAAGVSVGLAAYSLYVYFLTGSPFEWVDSIQRWGYRPGGPPWVPLVALARQLVRRPYEFLTLESNGPYDTLNGLTAAVFVLSVPFVWLRLGTAYALYMAFNLVLPLSSGQFEGLGRYCAVLFPFFIWLARCQSATVHHVIVIMSLSLYVLCLILFVNLYPLF